MVIDSVLQDNLPPHLRELDHSMSKLPVNWQSLSHIEASTGQSRGELSSEPAPIGGSHGESLLEQRSNIYDNDEFDVFRRKDIDRSRVHIGKK